MLFEDIVILDEIRDELFPLQNEEKQLLEESILKEGIRDPLIVWIPQEGPYRGKKILVDGHNRFEIAKKHNLKFKITIKEFSDLNEVLSWVVRNQLGRRNLTDEEKRYLLGKLYNIQKQSYGDISRISPRGQIVTMEETSSEAFEEKAGVGTFDQEEQTQKEQEKKLYRDTAEKIASQTEYASRTIKRYGAFADSVDQIKKISPDVAHQILSGKVKDALTVLPSVVKESPPDMLPKVVKKIEEGKKSIKEVVKEIVKDEVLEKAEKVELPTIVDIRCGNFREVLQDVQKVDAIITNPTYDKEHAEIWDQIGEFAQDKLVDGGYIAVFCNQSYLFEAYSILSKYLNYVWLFSACVEDKPARIVGGVNVLSSWKPVLVFGKNVSKFEKAVPDLLNTDREQLEAIRQLIETLTQVGDIVCDPFVGEASTPIACKLSDRQFVGAEEDEEKYKLAVVKVSEVKKEESVDKETH